MAQINRDRIAGMNIHYLYYSLPYFLDAQQKLGVKTIELWAGAPHFFLDRSPHLKFCFAKGGLLTPESLSYAAKQQVFHC